VSSCLAPPAACGGRDQARLRFTFATCCATFEMRRRKAGGSAHELGNPGDIAAVVPEIAPKYSPRRTWASPDQLDQLLGDLEPDGCGASGVLRRGRRRAPGHAPRRARRCRDAVRVPTWDQKGHAQTRRASHDGLAAQPVAVRPETRARRGHASRHRADHGPRRYPHAAAGLRRHHGRAARRPARRGLGHSLDRRIETG